MMGRRNCWPHICGKHGWTSTSQFKGLFSINTYKYKPLTYRWSGFSQVPPSLTFWWKETHWWSMSITRLRSIAGKTMVWITRLWTWGEVSGMRWRMSTWPQLFVWMSQEGARNTQWAQIVSTLEHKSTGRIVLVSVCYVLLVVKC